MGQEILNIVGGVQVADDVQNKIDAVGVKGLSLKDAQQLGVFQRIGNLLCVCHASIMAAYRIYGGVDYIIEQLHSRKNEISREMNLFEKSFKRFVQFWTNYYTHKQGVSNEVMAETESLYHNIMKWAQLPESWQIGESQRIDDDTDVSLRFRFNNKQYTFRHATANSDVEVERESWCVLKYSEKTNKQMVVEEGMDKPSAMMSAKRMSANDTECIYTAAVVRDVIEKKTVITPFKAYIENKDVGKIVKTLK